MGAGRTRNAAVSAFVHGRGIRIPGWFVVVSTMIQSLTRNQLILLRRCDGGLRVWETGAALSALMAEVALLRELGLVAHDEARGYELTPAGEACIVRFAS